MIEKEEAIKIFQDKIKTMEHGAICCDYGNDKDAFLLAILSIQALEQEQKMGHWIKENSIHGWDGNSYQCSECGRSIHLDLEVEDLNDYPYCHCGAKMTESEVQDDAIQSEA